MNRSSWSGLGFRKRRCGTPAGSTKAWPARICVTGSSPKLIRSCRQDHADADCGNECAAAQRPPDHTRPSRGGSPSPGAPVPAFSIRVRRISPALAVTTPAEASTGADEFAPATGDADEAHEDTHQTQASTEPLTVASTETFMNVLPSRPITVARLSDIVTRLHMQLSIAPKYNQKDLLTQQANVPRNPRPRRRWNRPARGAHHIHTLISSLSRHPACTSMED